MLFHNGKKIKIAREIKSPNFFVKSPPVFFFLLQLLHEVLEESFGFDHDGGGSFRLRCCFGETKGLGLIGEESGETRRTRGARGIRESREAN